MKITEQMVGSKFGEYAPTRQANIYKKKQKKTEKAYDGRTKAGRKFVERIIARRLAREAAKGNVK